VTTQPKALWLAYLLDVDPRSKAHHDEAAAELRRLHSVNAELLGALKNTTVNLIAAVSLLKSGGKKAAASDKMFTQMLADYTNSFERGRAAIARAEEVKP
jgi:hypothetical protein